MAVALTGTNFPAGASQAQVQAIIDAEIAASKPVTTITGNSSVTSGTGGSYSAWSVIHAGIPKACPAFGTILLGALYKSGSAAACFFQIGIGAAGSETALVTFSGDVLDNTNQRPVFTVAIPAYLPAGTRIAIRARSDDASSMVVKFGYAIGQIA